MSDVYLWHGYRCTRLNYIYVNLDRLTTISNKGQTEYLSSVIKVITWTMQRRQRPALTRDLATHRAAYAAERSTLVKSLPEKAPPPCAPQPPYVSTMILRPVKPASD